MSKTRQQIIEIVASILAVCVGIIAVVGAVFAIVLFVQWTFRGVGNWWHTTTYTSPEEKAEREKREKEWEDEWAVDPRNPKVAGQKCLDLGGIPDYSSWDGDVKACNKPGGGNIDIKQSVEVKQ